MTGQAALVRVMCSSGARIAPAGAGKTTAMRTLARAWSDSGGQVVGLAPSAAAAAQLRDAAGVPADTLAKLTWSIHHADLPDWADRISRSTLVIIDEAGMADTLTLDTAVQFVIGRGGSVRLVGDDQQLAAIGAGDVLRDIQASHGAVRLSELHRFADLAEAAATLAIRDGRPEALGFYLDRRRVHVGDPTTTLDAVFHAWQNDRNQGLDSIMLAPTRELVSRLNQRARDHRLAGSTPDWQVELADGNPGSVGDLIITRRNDRRLRITATDWVKNGDRWTILNLGRTGGLTARHIRNGRMIRLPAGYVQEAVELGYATTMHTAQGVTADTMHGVVTAEESRQQLYTMLTRGRTANHIYVTVVGDGTPHTVIQPDNVGLRTATELLELILARDASPQSATTLHWEQHDPAVRLGTAAARYLDALHVAAERLAGPEMATNEQAADSPPGGLAGGPLPWLPGITDRIAADLNWGPYLNARSHLVAELAEQVRRNAAGEAPAWAAQLRAPIPAELIADIQVWRAATEVDPIDLRPTGPRQLDYAARIF
jgi:AAA domain